jgi:hypothetical protein
MAFSTIKNVSQVAFEVSSTVYAFKCGIIKASPEIIGQSIDFIDNTGDFHFENFRINFVVAIGARTQALDSKGSADILNYLASNTTPVYFYPAYRINGTATTYAAIKHKVRFGSKNFTSFESKTAGIIQTYFPLSIETIESITTLPDYMNF